MSVNNWTIGGSIALLGGVVTIWATVPWADVLPTTRAQHLADMETLRAEYEVSLQEHEKGVDMFYRNWKCDEWFEELDELLEKKEAGDESLKLEERIQRLRDKIDENNCSEFE